MILLPNTKKNWKKTVNILKAITTPKKNNRKLYFEALQTNEPLKYMIIFNASIPCFTPFDPPNPTRSTSSTSFPLSRRPPPKHQDTAPNSIGRSPAPTAPPWAVKRPSFSALQPAEPLAPAPRRRRWHRRPRPAWAFSLGGPLVGGRKEAENQHVFEGFIWKILIFWWIFSYMENFLIFQ